MKTLDPRILMNESFVRLWKVLFALLVLFALTTSTSIAPASAQSGGGYDLTWNSIDGGGAMFSSGGAYSLGGTIGQADAGTMSGGAYTLNGGFWVDFFGNKLMLPLILK